MEMAPRFFLHNALMWHLRCRRAE